MGNRAYNFNAGPSALPLEVLQKAQEELTDYRGIGMSIMEVSHRSQAYDEVHEQALQRVRDLLQVPSGYQVIFMQGGASTQFAMIPMNFLQGDKQGSYVITGSWAEKAAKEAEIAGGLHIAAQSDSYTKIPDLSSIRPDDHAAYLHVTSNETIEGIQYQQFPDSGRIPLIADMSSDIMSRPLDMSQFGMIYAGAQKNLGPSGVTLVIVREDLLADIPKHVPTMMRYDTHASKNSLYNTPPVYSIYMMNLVMGWIEEQGGLADIERKNKEKTDLIYNCIDQSQGFYAGTADALSRSRMNITFRLRTEELEQAFLKEAASEGFVGLKGHRSVGGLRASTYNAVPYEHCKALCDFMQDFYQRNA